MPVGDDSNLKDEPKAITSCSVARQSKFDIVFILKLLYDLCQIVFLDLSFRANIVFNRRFIILVQRLEGSQNPVEFFVLTLLVSHLNAMGRPLDTLVSN